MQSQPMNSNGPLSQDTDQHMTSAFTKRSGKEVDDMDKYQWNFICISEARLKNGGKLLTDKEHNALQ